MGRDSYTVDILAQGRKVRVGLHPALEVESLRPGQELLLNEALKVVAAAGYEIQGDVVVLNARHGKTSACRRRDLHEFLIQLGQQYHEPAIGLNFREEDTSCLRGPSPKFISRRGEALV